MNSEYAFPTISVGKCEVCLFSMQNTNQNGVWPYLVGVTLIPYQHSTISLKKMIKKKAVCPFTSVSAELKAAVYLPHKVMYMWIACVQFAVIYNDGSGFSALFRSTVQWLLFHGLGKAALFLKENSIRGYYCRWKQVKKLQVIALYA